MVERRNVEFAVEGGDRLRGWLFVPKAGISRCAAISMAHGYAGVKEHGLERIARAFAEAGFVVLVHDHQNFGASDGGIRQDIQDFMRLDDDTSTAQELYDRMLAFYPDRINPGSLWGSAHAAKASAERRTRG